MRLKPGVKLAGVQPELVLALQLAEPVVLEFLPLFTVTSIGDGKHMPRSLHYKGWAFDFRTWIYGPGDVSQRTLERLRGALSTALGDEFDVVLESDHIHVEFDPK